ERATEMSVHRVEQRRAAFPEQLAQLAQMTREVSAVHELRNRRLQERRRYAAGYVLGGGKRVDHPGGQDQVGEAERRKEDLAERPGIDHASRPIESLDRRERPAQIAELAVVIILDDPRSEAHTSE